MNAQAIPETVSLFNLHMASAIGGGFVGIGGLSAINILNSCTLFLGFHVYSIQYMGKLFVDKP